VRNKGPSQESTGKTEDHVQHGGTIKGTPQKVRKITAEHVQNKRKKISTGKLSQKDRELGEKKTSLQSVRNKR